MSEQAEQDPLHPAQRVYALAVAAAGRKYQAAVKAARDERDREVSEALNACWQVLEMEKK
jgi:hypothetical protein